MELYHSTKSKEKILADGKIKIKNKKNFNYNKYLEYILSRVYEMDEPIKLVGNYPSSRISAPFMGHGLYCFDNMEQAQSFQTNAQVLCVSYPDDVQIIDFDDPEVILHFFSLLEVAQDSIDTKITDEGARNGWLALLELLKKAIMEEFRDSQPAVGLILHVVNWLFQYPFPDLLIRSFYVKIGLGIVTDETEKYYLIKSVDKISNLC